MKLRNKIILGLLVVLLLALTAYKLIANKKEIDKKAQYKENTENVPVVTEKAVFTKGSKNASYTGTLLPLKEVNFGSEAAGKISSVYVQEGQTLSKGQLIAQVNVDLLKIKRNADLAQYKKTKKDLERFQNLSNEDATSEIQLSNAKLAYEMAKSNLEATQEQISNARITAPIAGVLTTKNFEVGAIVSPGVPIGTITDIQTLKMQAYVPEAAIIKFNYGQQVAVTVDVYPGVTFKGTVIQIGAKGDTSHNFKLDVKVHNNSQTPLKSGMYGKILTTDNDPKKQLTVSRKAVIGTEKKPQVYVVKNGKAHLKDISTGNSSNDKIEILSGLSDGDQVVTNGQINLKDGATVKTSN